MSGSSPTSTPGTAHARVEDRIRVAKDTGLGRFPSQRFAINQAWLTAVMIAADLLAWTQTMLLHDSPLATAEPKTLRYRLLHVAARLTRRQRRLWLRIDQHWRWPLPRTTNLRSPRFQGDCRIDLARAFTRVATLPRPIT